MSQNKPSSNSAHHPSMRILLINPPNSGRSIPEEKYGIDSNKMVLRGEPLALEVLAGALSEHEVRILDLKASNISVAEEVATFSPDIVGITGMTCEANSMLRIAREVRSVKKAITVVGGIHASNDPAFFNQEEVDYVVIGVGKLSFKELVTALAQEQESPSINGIAKTNPGGKLTFNSRKYCKADLVEEAPPRYDLVKSNRSEYFVSYIGEQIGMVVTAYGCPYRCNFCCIEPLTGGRYLSHKIETVIRDINLLPDIDFIRLVDANSFGNPKHARMLCDALKEQGVEKQLVADVRSDTIVNHPEMMRAWKDVGLRSVIVGFENIDNNDLQEMNKSNEASHNIDAIRILRELGITIVGDFIVSPDYEHADFDLLERYLNDNPIDLPILTIMTPLPGTQYHCTIKDQITNHNLDYYTLMNAVTPTKMPEKDFYMRYTNLVKASLHNTKL